VIRKRTNIILALLRGTSSQRDEHPYAPWGIWVRRLDTRPYCWPQFRHDFGPICPPIRGCCSERDFPARWAQNWAQCRGVNPFIETKWNWHTCRLMNFATHTVRSPPEWPRLVKRRRALVETNPPRNSQPRLIETMMVRGTGFGRFPFSFAVFDHTSDRKISSCLKKLMVAPCDVVAGLAACSNSSGGR
jgi:hypothetical protein